MMALFGPRKASIPLSNLKKFVKNCKWGNRSKQDWIGRHGMGWGVMWLDNLDNIKVKRFFRPIWEYNWEFLTKIKSELIIVHARFAFEKKFMNIHPIKIKFRGNNFYLFHNGIIKIASFPCLKNSRLKCISQNSEMDTRCFLATIIDFYNSGDNKVDSIKTTLLKSGIKLFNSANSIFVNDKDVFVTSFHRKISPLLEYNTYQLHIYREKKGNCCVSVIPFSDQYFRLPNSSIVHYNIQSNSFSVYKI